MPVKIFFSYSHADEGLRNELAKHLAVMQRNGFIESWHDRRVDAGAEIDPSIVQALEMSEIVLCLVSPDFLASHYCYEREMKRALERRRAGECEVIPILLRQSDWLETPLAALRSTPNDNKPVMSFANRDDAFHIVTQDIRRVVERFRDKASGVGTSALAPPSPPTAVAGAGRSVPIDALEAPSARQRIRRKFTDADKDQFIEGAFAQIAAFVESELGKLELEAPHLKGKFQRVDARSFSASVYEEGRRAASGSVWHGAGGWGSSDGIYYSSSPQASHGSYSEMLSISDDGFELSLRPLGMAMRSRGKERLSPSEAARYLWDILVAPLVS